MTIEEYELIEMTEDAETRGYNKACNDMLFILGEMRETTQAMMQPDLEYACNRFIEQVEKLKKENGEE